MNTHAEFLQNTGPTLDGMTTREPSRPEIPANGELTSSQAAIHANPILEQSEAMSPNTRALRVSSSGLLMRFARDLFCERIRPLCEGMHLHHGGSSEMAWNALVTLACPSSSEPVALAVATKGSECSCSARYPTPTATDWKGGKANKRGVSLVLRDKWKEWTGQTYLPVEVSTAVQGFPPMWTKCEELGTPFLRQSPNGSAAGS